MSSNSVRWTVYFLVLGICTALGYTLGFYQGIDSQPASVAARTTAPTASVANQSPAEQLNKPKLKAKTFTFFVGDIVLSEKWKGQRRQRHGLPQGITSAEVESITLADFVPLIDDLKKAIGPVEEPLNMQPYVAKLSLIVTAEDAQHELVLDRLAEIRMEVLAEQQASKTLKPMTSNVGIFVATYYVGDIVAAKQAEDEIHGVTLADFEPLIDEIEKIVKVDGNSATIQPYVANLSLMLGANASQHKRVQERLAEIRLKADLPISPKPLARAK